MFSKAFNFIRINPNFADEETGKFEKTDDISSAYSGFLGDVEAGIKGKTFYQLCKHRTSCLLFEVMKLGTSASLLALSPRTWCPRMEQLTRLVRPHTLYDSKNGKRP